MESKTNENSELDEAIVAINKGDAKGLEMCSRWSTYQAYRAGRLKHAHESVQSELMELIDSCRSSM